MFKLLQGTLSSYTGIVAEPEYGREAFHPITDFVKDKQPLREATSKDFEWLQPASTNVETQTFYFTCEKSGYVGFFQVIHSVVVGNVYTTAQFTFRIFNRFNKDETVWTSTHLEDFVIKGNNFYAQNFAIELSEDGNTYTFKSAVNPESIVDVTITKEAPAVIIGENGTSYYGTDIKNPWGSMRHAFWPRNNVKGTIKLGEKEIDIDGKSMYVMALQGMKPHHAASTWNFLNYQGPHYSAVQMEFTTPNSYAKTKVNVGILVKDDKILAATVDNNAVHKDTEKDKDVGWPVPKEIDFDFNGYTAESTDEEIQNKTAKVVKANLKGKLETLVLRIDVMGEIPGFVKSLAGVVAGTKPYIYQWINPYSFEIDYNGEVSKEEGLCWNEATFISE